LQGQRIKLKRKKERKEKKNKTTESPTVSSRGLTLPDNSNLLLYCAVQSRSPSHWQLSVAFLGIMLTGNQSSQTDQPVAYKIIVDVGLEKQ